MERFQKLIFAPSEMKNVKKTFSGLDKLSPSQKLGFVKESLFHTIENSFNNRRGVIKPRHLVNIITWQCNSDCIMCNISRTQDPGKQMTIEEYEEILSDADFWKPLNSMNVTGGEPFLRKDINEIILLFRDNCPNLKNVSISTNGFLTERILDSVEKLLDELDIELDVSVSLDGIGKVHDEIRGIEGAFHKTRSTIESLKEIEKQNANFKLLGECVVLQNNITHLDDFWDYCHSNDIHTSFIIPSFQKSYYDNLDKKHLGPSRDQIKKIYQRRHFIDYYIHKQLDQGKRFLPCNVGFGTFTLNPYGDIYFCHNLPAVGNIREKSIGRVWLSEEARKTRKIITKRGICSDCFFSCDLSSAVKEDFFLTLKFGLVHYLMKAGILELRTGEQ